MRWVLGLALVCFVGSAAAEETGRTCGSLLVDDSPRAARAAFQSALDLYGYLQRRCRAGDTLTVQGAGHYAAVGDLIGMTCDFSRQIIVEPTPAIRPSAGSIFTCVYIGRTRELRQGD